MARIFDGLRNIVANLATARDKASHSEYFDSVVDENTLLVMYGNSATAKNVVDLPAEDATREWREWQAEAPQIELIEAEEKRLGLQGSVMTALKRAGLFGGSAIYIGTRDLNPAVPLNPERIGKGGLTYLAVMNRMDLTAGELQRDPRLPGYGKPMKYTLQAGAGKRVEIHPSRLVVFTGEDVPDVRQSTQQGWGDSKLKPCWTSVRNLDATIANIASLIFEAKIDVVGINGFNEGLRSGGAAYEAMILARAQLSVQGKGINGALLMDKEDTYSQKSANFANLPELLDRFMQMVSSSSGIPMSRLFGISAAGLNATGEGDEKVYFDRVRVMQTLEIDPAMQILNECLIRSALGDRPKDIWWTWRPLFSPSEKERGDLAKVLIDGAKAMHDMGTIPQEAVAQSLINALTENGSYPGLDSLADEFEVEGDEGDDLDGETDPNAPPQEGVEPKAAGTGKAKPVADAAPRTLYISRKVTNAKEILAWAKDQGFTQTLPAEELHVTIAYSRSPLDWMKLGEPWEADMEVAAGGPRLMDRFGADGGATVLLFNKSALTWRNEEVTRAGGTWDHAEYQPHITIAYGEAPDLAPIVPYRGVIKLGPEIFAEVDEGWKAKVLA